MPYFTNEAEVYRYIGEVFREAGADPQSGPALRSADVTLQMHFTDPAAQVTVRFGEPFEVIEGATDVRPDVELSMSADVADQYWRGEYNLAVGLAKRQVRSKGPVNKILKLVPLTKPLFPRYRALTSEKDGALATT